eukprot:2900319-Alexandrium_andersonii.AAC.1
MIEWHRHAGRDQHLATPRMWHVWLCFHHASASVARACTLRVSRERTCAVASAQCCACAHTYARA